MIMLTPLDYCILLILIVCFILMCYNTKTVYNNIYKFKILNNNQYNRSRLIIMVLLSTYFLILIGYTFYLMLNEPGFYLGN
jgi:cell division septal protein FtsQ